MTRYGPLSLPPDVLAGIAFATDDTGVHTVTLTDGTHFGGLVTVPEFTATLTAGGPGRQADADPLPDRVAQPHRLRRRRRAGRPGANRRPTTPPPCTSARTTCWSAR